MHAPSLLTETIAFERLAGTRIVAAPAALDELDLPREAVALRFAADELFVTPPLVDLSTLLAADAHAIAIDDAAFSGAWIQERVALDLLERHCQWPIPTARPAFAQGAVAGIATKLWLDEGRVLFVVPTPFAHEMEERLR